MNKTYCISDLHGHYKIMLAMLKKINFDDSDELYILGDCNDRGSFAFEIYTYIFGHKNMHLIKGNHELMMRDMLLSGKWDSPDGRLWSHNGGKKTLQQFKDHTNVKPFDCELNDSLFANYAKKMVEKINLCPNFIELTINNREFVLIHSGINPEKGLYEQTEEECCWMREYFFLSKGLDNKTIVFGHTPTILIDPSKEFGVWFDPVYKDKIGIDGGLANYSEGRLNCLCLNDKSVTYIKKSELED